MIEFINNLDDLNIEKSKFRTVFKEGFEFPENVFLTDFKHFISFDFDEIYTDEFFGCLMAFLKDIKSNNFTFYTIKPDLEKYFFTHFNRYSVGIITHNHNSQDFTNFILRDPGGSPADALAYNAEFICLFSNDESWGIIGSKDLEIGLVGFKNNSKQDLFLDKFIDDITFTTIKKQIESMSHVFNKSKETKEFLKQLILSYSTH